MLNSDLSVLFKLCHYHPNLIPGWIFCPGGGSILPGFINLGGSLYCQHFWLAENTLLLDTLLNTHCLETWINRLIISVLCGTSLVAAQEMNPNPILFKMQAWRMPVNSDTNTTCRENITIRNKTGRNAENERTGSLLFHCCYWHKLTVFPDWWWKFEVVEIFICFGALKYSMLQFFCFIWV